jgi:hypothetical protein
MIAAQEIALIDRFHAASSRSVRARSTFRHPLPHCNPHHPLRRE